MYGNIIGVKLAGILDKKLAQHKRGKLGPPIYIRASIVMMNFT